jgi:tripartite ATP-independent transporter DctP family solute receptor
MRSFKSISLTALSIAVLITSISLQATIGLTSCRKSEERAEPIVIRVGHTHTSDHSYQIGLQETKQIVEQQTGGRITIEFYPGAQLGNERQMQDMLGAGTLDVAVTGLVNIYDPAFALFDFPFLYRDRQHIRRVMYSDLMKEMQAPLIDQGLRILGVMEVGFRNITSNEPINTPDDLRGFRIRTPESPAQFETFKAMGAIPTPMSYNVLYGALYEGVVDGQENPLENIYNAKFYEVQKYVTMTRHIYNFAYVLVSEKLWQSLSSEDQDILSEAVRYGCDYQMDYLAAKEKELEQALKDEGMQFIYPDRDLFKKAAGPAYQSDFVKDLEPRASKILDQIRSLEQSAGE